MMQVIRIFKYMLETLIHKYDFKNNNEILIVYVDSSLYSHLKVFDTGYCMWLEEFRNIKIIKNDNIPNYYIIDASNILIENVLEI